jgi:hypothetical protein
LRVSTCASNLSPLRASVCPGCGRAFDAFPGVTPPDQAQLHQFIRSGRTVSAIVRLRELSGCSLETAKAMIEHMYGAAGVPTRSGDV